LLIPVSLAAVIDTDKGTETVFPCNAPIATHRSLSLRKGGSIAVYRGKRSRVSDRKGRFEKPIVHLKQL
jgi:hypothetical protein